MKHQIGFTLIEILVASTIMLMVFALVYTAFIQTRKIALRNEMDVEILQNARIGLDEMTRTIRMIGYQRDRYHGQVAIIEAAPFQLIFNADIYEQYSALPSGWSLHLYDATDYVAPMQNYTTKAETIRWTLDTNDDGIVDRYDTNDNKEERLTSQNPDDMVLIQEINGGYDRQITLSMLGPFDAHDQRTNLTPMFQYWLLGSGKRFSLLGDVDGDGILTGDEGYFRSITSQNLLQRIRRIHITLTTESDAFDPFNPGQHRRVTLSSTVGLRNME
jgi:prepilin-type N-terminal cleavage/methylation domain-containing protein